MIQRSKFSYQSKSKTSGGLVLGITVSRQKYQNRESTLISWYISTSTFALQKLSRGNRVYIKSVVNDDPLSAIRTHRALALTSQLLFSGTCTGWLC